MATTDSERLTGSAVAEALAEGLSRNVGIEVVPPDAGDARGLFGRLVAAVPGCALVVVGSVRGDSELPFRPGMALSMRTTIARMRYRFDCQVASASIERDECSSWVIRTTYPTTLEMSQRRAYERAHLAGSECPVHLGRHFGAPTLAQGQAVNVSASGLLGEFGDAVDGPSAILRIGAGARLVFALPENGRPTDSQMAALRRLQDRARTQPASGDAELIEACVFSVGARVVWMQEDSGRGEMVGFHFEEIPPDSEKTIAEFVARRRRRG
jgi:c-di-GMP-binding flagellar brake protein YcgR